jgi:hypothetical protein
MVVMNHKLADLDESANWADHTMRGGPTAEVSDGGGHKNLESANRSRPLPFAPRILQAAPDKRLIRFRARLSAHEDESLARLTMTEK